MRYTAVTGIAVLVAMAFAVFGLNLAGQTFAGPSDTGGGESVGAATEDPDISEPTSALLGRSEKVVNPAAHGDDAQKLSQARKDWVEVVDAVNMRAGPSSSNRVIEVQLAGSQLQMGDRDGGWIQVIEPDSGAQGWVFEKYVKRINPASLRANPGTTTRIQ
ncbi:SH3 domain-containing protein [Methyloligella solikamskensis]|uniref:SH3 domain-containing protein n=1 Tax=Methyloligella solikamskensis TaxID=1177756 RepID=A0ABW3JBS5_9HYPH